MNGCKTCPVVLLAMAGIFGIVGCGTTNPTVFKERGVYTTLAMEGHNLDMPASGYMSCKTFNPGQTPTAVVVGYGYWDGSVNHAQPFNLQVVEIASGTIILDRSGEALAGKAATIDLPIRKSGDYRVKLIINNSVFDTWDFTVNREATAGNSPGASPPPAYAKGMFGVLIESSNDAFAEYDQALINDLLASVTKEAGIGNQDIFAQVQPGKVVIRFNLDANGQVSSPQIIGNTLTEDLGQFFLRALQNGAPYKVWPDTARAAIGPNQRVVKADFSYN